MTIYRTFLHKQQNTHPSQLHMKKIQGQVLCWYTKQISINLTRLKLNQATFEAQQCITRNKMQEEYLKNYTCGD